MAPSDTRDMLPFVRRVQIRNYKSIAACSIPLKPLTFLVGRNGAGKSNFLDAFRFTADALTTTLDLALRDRGSIKDVRRRSGGHPNHFAISMDLILADGTHASYGFRIGARPNGGFLVQREECRIFSKSKDEPFFIVENGAIAASSHPTLPLSLPDRLTLVAVSGIPEFRPVYDALTRMEVYNLNPSEIRRPQPPDMGELLRRDGSNLASMLQHLSEEQKQIINRYIEEIVPNIEGADARHLAGIETIEFRQKVKSQKHPWRFLASSMSDGTLRALGILVAIFQQGAGGKKAPTLIGLEEPEGALHPGAAAHVMRALHQASEQRQIVVTTHSPELLDNEDIHADSILAVESLEGTTMIAGVDEVTRQQIQEHLFTAGELLRLGQIQLDSTQTFETSSLFTE